MWIGSRLFCITANQLFSITAALLTKVDQSRKCALRWNGKFSEICLFFIQDFTAVLVTSVKNYLQKNVSIKE